MTCLHIPDRIICTDTGNVFYGEEFLLVSLYRLHRPNSILDACWCDTFGLNYSAVSKCFTEFLKFMVSEWEYLLIDNLEFWLPQLPACAQAIRNKCAKLGCVFPDAIPAAPGGFRVFGFIDNTMNATCRPGGGTA